MADAALRPRTILEILDASFALLRRDYFKLVTIMAIVSIPAQLATLAMIPYITTLSAGPTSDDVFAGLEVATMFIPGLVWLMWYPIVDSALIEATSESYLGREIKIPAVLGKVAKRLRSLALLSIVKAFVLGLGLLFFVIPGVYFYLRFFCAPATTIVEGKPAIKSLSRSSQLTVGYKGKIFAAMFLIILINQCLSAVPAIPLAFAGTPSALLVAGVLSSVLLYPMVPIVVTLVYYDMRIRKEGLDIELLGKELDAAPAGQTQG